MCNPSTQTHIICRKKKREKYSEGRILRVWTRSRCLSRLFSFTADPEITGNTGRSNNLGICSGNGPNYSDLMGESALINGVRRNRIWLIPVHDFQKQSYKRRDALGAAYLMNYTGAGRRKTVNIWPYLHDDRRCCRKRRSTFVYLFNSHMIKKFSNQLWPLTVILQ